MIMFASRTLSILRRVRARATARRHLRQELRSIMAAVELAEAVEAKAGPISVGQAIDVLATIDLGPYHFLDIGYQPAGLRIGVAARSFDGREFVLGKCYPTEKSWLRRADVEAFARAFERDFARKVREPIADILMEANDG